MKRSRFVAVMVVCVMVMGVIQPAFAYSQKTTQKATQKATEKTTKDTLSKYGDYVGYAKDAYDVGKEIYNGNYSGAAKEATKVAVNRVVVTPVATTAAGTVVTTLGLTGIVATGGTLLIVAGAGYGVSKLIDWMW